MTLFSLPRLRRGLVWIAVAACVMPAFAQNNDGKLSLVQQQKLIAEIERGDMMVRNLEELCDGIGARLTGSKELRQAQHWAIDKLTSYGAKNVHEEAYKMGPTWMRGQSSARLLNANRQTIAMAQRAWTTSSKHTIRAEVIVLKARTLDEFRSEIPKLKGKIVLALTLPSANAEQRKNPEQYAKDYASIVQEAKMAAVLFVSERQGSLLDMNGGPQARLKHNVGIISKEHANLLQRLVARGVTPQMELQFGGKFAAQASLAYNVVADLPGAEMPEEMVIVGVHQDSWDLATGATDNGVGVVLAMEVLRSIQASKVPLKRSLRVVLFSGEEQGLLGSKAYVAQHQSELAKIQAMITVDSGAGRIIGFPDMQVDAWYTALQEISASVPLLHQLDIVYGISNGSDHQSFFEKGIPAFSAIQEPMDYLSHTWHSEVDTIDHVKPEYLLHNAKILSLLTMSLLNAPKLPIAPHRAAPN
ncbi:MAG: M20/M25/M40 family metallo-hydrolase [Burkholderiaceae bacterium]|nr:MAG: M20/M25/M40 family metallo-hydrolase [Burkholderiaceae bacterium]